MRDLAENPEENLCFIYISENGSAYHIVAASDVTEGIRPTSELLTHLAIHQMLIHTKRPELAVVHAHVTELIALSHIPGLNSEEAVNNLLWGMHPETKMFVPDGAGYVPFEVPGSETLARSTVKAFESHQAVIWEKHGCMAIAESVPDAFDTLDILAKAARIWFLVKGATGG
jgi:rhamnulose-1-phosphate aldolase